ncbi:hypothetical protein cyc_00160 [Cyclospora cayetanensis]|uniref:Uncharacterized protein n=1 Tax=Cyclospora cayetanensis TaxID=88456 RepID=A0A1D3CXK2_9EIME|nr:hypothetical protein cyc_00160 [Cyclospora cayetanensis]
MGLLQQHEGSSPSSAAASPCQQQPKDEAEECQHQRQAVYRVRLPRALLFKPVLSHTPEEAPPSAEKDFELSLEEAAASAVESWIDPDGSDFAAAAAEALEEEEAVRQGGTEDPAAVLPLLAYRVAALFAFFDAKSKDPLAVGTLGRTLSCLLRSLAFVLGRLLKGPLGRRRLKLSVAAAAENATVVATPPPDAAAEAPAAAQLPASHVLYQHHSFNLYAEFCLCMRGNPQSVEAPLPASGSFDILPLPAVAGVTFPLVVSAKKRWSLEKGAPKTSSSGASAERASLDAVDVREDEVVFLGEGLRFRILECIRILVRAASGRDGYMALVESVTRSEVPIHLKAVCLPGLLAATAKIRRKKDRFITQLCSIIMNKTLPVRAPHSATESLAKLLPSTAKRQVQQQQKDQQQQVQQQKDQQQEPGVKGSFPVLAVGSDVSLPLRLLILAHATQGLVVALDAGSGASNGLDKKTESFGQEELEQEREAQKKGSGEADPQTEQHADNPLVAMHAIQSVLFKALELSVPLLADPFMAPPTPEGSACVQIDRSRLHSMQREPWSGACQALAEFDSLVRQSGALLSRGEETLCYALQRLNICAAPAPQQGDMEMGGRLHAAAEEQDGCLSSLGIADVEDGPVEASFLKEKLKAEHFALRGGDMTVLYRCVAVPAGAVGGAKDPLLALTNLNVLAFVVQTQLINREETIAEGSERLSCVLNWLKLVLLQGHKNPNRGPNKAHGSNPFYAMGLLLLRSLKQPLLEALRRLASQADAEEVLTQSRGGPEGLRGPQCLLGRGAPSTADKVELLRPCGGAMRHSSAAAEQRMRLQLVCLVLQEMRSPWVGKDA